MRRALWVGLSALVMGFSGLGGAQTLSHGSPGTPGDAGGHGSPGTHGSAGHAGHAGHHGKAQHMAPDLRILVNYPPALKAHTLASMRQHLATLHDIQAALAQSQFDHAAMLAERHLGMSSLHDHKASENAQHMPPEMAAIGTAMHRAASQFVVVARDASVTGDLAAALGALSKVSAQCVACHAAYRLQ